MRTRAITARGRPRDERLDAKILDVTAALLADVGWDHLTMRLVAEQAGVSLATIYRRWATKTELVIAALQSLLAPMSELLTANDESVTTEQLLAPLALLVADRVDLIGGILAASRADPAYDALLREQVLQPMRDAFAAHVRARAGGAVDEQTVELIADIGPALLLVRVGVLGEPAGDATVSAIATVIDRAIAGSSARPRRRAPR